MAATTASPTPASDSLNPSITIGAANGRRHGRVAADGDRVLVVVRAVEVPGWGLDREQRQHDEERHQHADLCGGFGPVTLREQFERAEIDAEHPLTDHPGEQVGRDDGHPDRERRKTRQVVGRTARRPPSGTDFEGPVVPSPRGVTHGRTGERPYSSLPRAGAVGAIPNDGSDRVATDARLAGDTRERPGARDTAADGPDGRA